MKKPLTFVMCAALAAASCASAATISVNFAENNNQAFVGGQNIGPLATNSSTWNSTAPTSGITGSLSSGSLNSPLINDSGAATTATLSWTASGTDFSDDSLSNDQGKLAIGHLNGTFTVTVSNIPYAQYRVYGLVSAYENDAPTFVLRNTQVNGTFVFGGDGTTTATAYSGAFTSTAAEGSAWTLLSPGDVGNYWVSATTSGSTLTISNANATGNRGTLSGFIIEQVVAVPEPSTALLGGLGLIGLLRRRRA